MIFKNTYLIITSHDNIPCRSECVALSSQRDGGVDGSQQPSLGGDAVDCPIVVATVDPCAISTSRPLKRNIWAPEFRKIW